MLMLNALTFNVKRSAVCIFRWRLRLLVIIFVHSCSSWVVRPNLGLSEEAARVPNGSVVNNVFVR